MRRAYVLIQTLPGRAIAVALQIVGIAGVVKTEVVTGPYDVFVTTESRGMDELGKLVIKEIQEIDGVVRTLTCPVVNI